MFKAVPNVGTREAQQSVEAANAIVEWYESHRPELMAHAATEAQNECVRQLMYGLPPSEGMPDVRIRYSRY
jgi:hypothetical protein